NQDCVLDSGEAANGGSRLIEFPGATRTVPAWRKQLSQRVREVQERKAREAAEELAAAQEAGLVSCALPSGHLELVPDLEQPVMNPIVSKALERLDRARREDHQPGSYGRAVATAPALAPDIEALTAEEFLAVQPRAKLTVVSSPQSSTAPIETNVEADSPEELSTGIAGFAAVGSAERKPVRVIAEDDAALSYLDTCLSVPALATDTRGDLPALS